MIATNFLPTDRILLRPPEPGRLFVLGLLPVPEVPAEPAGPGQLYLVAEVAHVPLCRDFLRFPAAALVFPGAFGE